MATASIDAPEPASIPTPLPFALDHDDDYQIWRRRKLQDYPTDINELIVPVQEIDGLSLKEIHALQERVNKANFAIYELPKSIEVSKLQIQRFGQQLGQFAAHSHSDRPLARAVQDRAQHVLFFGYWILACQRF